MDWRGEKRGLKRNRSVSSSVGSSPLPSPKARKIKMSGLDGDGWNNGAYNLIYLTLLEQTMTRVVVLRGELSSPRFWESFTDRLNFRIKESLSPIQLSSFGDFAPHEVTLYGEDLRSTYTQNKDKVDVEEYVLHFPLYRRVFQRCDHRYPSFPSQDVMLGIKPKRSRSYASGASAPTSSLASGMPEIINSTTTKLSILLNKNKITLPQATRALEIFRDDGSVGLLWLKMNRVKRLEYVRSLGDQ